MRSQHKIISRTTLTFLCICVVLCTIKCAWFFCTIVIFESRTLSEFWHNFVVVTNEFPKLFCRTYLIKFALHRQSLTVMKIAIGLFESLCALYSLHLSIADWDKDSGKESIAFIISKSQFRTVIDNLCMLSITCMILLKFRIWHRLIHVFSIASLWMYAW